MLRWLPWRVLLLAAACGLSAVPTLAQETPRSELEETARVRLRTARIRIEPRTRAGGTAGECLELGLDDLAVQLRGERLAPENLLELDRRRLRTVHAIVLDTSGSMVGHLDFVRRAARRYLEQLHPDHERALVATFDESVLLLQGPSGDRAELSQALERVRMAGSTSVYDGVYYAIRELESYNERGVILLLTDGVDNSSFHDRFEINRLVERRPDLTVFTIGLALPALATHASVKPFLQRLALRTNGKFFDVPTSRQLPKVFLKIREILDNEATLVVLDPQAEDESGGIRVRSLSEACKVRVLRRRQDRDERPDQTIPDFFALPQVVPFPPGDSYVRLAKRAGHMKQAPRCGERERPVEEQDKRRANPDWHLLAGESRMQVCAMDLTMEPGPVFEDSVLSSYVRWNAWVYMRTRRLEIRVPPLDALPRRPEAWMDRLGRHSLTVIANDVVTDPFAVPQERHGRPYEDYPFIAHGKTFLEARWPLAHGMYLYPDYRRWVLDRLAAEAEREIEDLKKRFRRVSPDSPDALLDQVARDSPEGLQILQRAREPTAVDLQQYLSAWLGDIPAHDLFRRWETLHVNELLEGGLDLTAERFVDQWRELRRVFFAPSYARVLTLMSPVFDETHQRVGYWRIILPRPGWLGARVQNQQDHPEWADLPLDLVPDLPFGLLALRRAFEEDVALRDRVRKGRYRVREIRYELLGVSSNDEPNRAFRESRVGVTLEAPGKSTVRSIRLTADFGWNPEEELHRLERVTLNGAELFVAEPLKRSRRSKKSR